MYTQGVVMGSEPLRNLVRGSARGSVSVPRILRLLPKKSFVFVNYG